MASGFCLDTGSASISASCIRRSATRSNSCGDVRFCGRAVLKRDRGNNGPDALIGPCGLRNPAGFVEMLARRHVDLDEDELVHVHPSRSLAEILRPVAPVQERNVPHPRKAQSSRVVDVNVGIDDRKIRQSDSLRFPCAQLSLVAGAKKLGTFVTDLEYWFHRGNVARPP